MCWGFECGDGWYNILNALMGNIQDHIDWKEKQRKQAIDYNEMVAQAKAGNFDLFEEANKSLTDEEYKNELLAGIIAGDFRKVPESIPQVKLDQVKEKFGTLRFYYTGGDDYVRGLVSMAESMSAITCETCGNPGEQTRGGWIKTICQSCEDKRAAEYQAYHAPKEIKKETTNEIKYQFIGEDTGYHD